MTLQFDFRILFVSAHTINIQGLDRILQNDVWLWNENNFFQKQLEIKPGLNYLALFFSTTDVDLMFVNQNLLQDFSDSLYMNVPEFPFPVVNLHKVLIFPR